MKCVNHNIYLSELFHNAKLPAQSPFLLALEQHTSICPDHLFTVFSISIHNSHTLGCVESLDIDSRIRTVALQSHHSNI